jgi:hypothetical protein
LIGDSSPMQRIAVPMIGVVSSTLLTLTMASLEGDATAHRALLQRLRRRLRAYYKGRLARIERSATEAEDLVQEALIAIHIHVNLGAA